MPAEREKLNHESFPFQRPLGGITEVSACEVYDQWAEDTDSKMSGAYTEALIG